MGRYLMWRLGRSLTLIRKKEKAMRFFVRRLCNSGSGEKHCFSRFDPCGKSKSMLTKDVYAPFPERKHKVVGYCRGLLCLEYDNGEILIWNPSMNNEFKLLPPSPTPPPPCPSPNCDGNCTVSVVSVVRGLGFDPRSKDYKVVKFVANYYDHHEEYDHAGLSKRVEVYSLKKDCWKGIDGSSDYEIVDECATYVNGCCYWIALNNLDYRRLIIVSLDLGRETFTAIKFPQYNRPSPDAIHSNRLGHCSILLTPVMKNTLAAVPYHPTSNVRIDKTLKPLLLLRGRGRGGGRVLRRWTSIPTVCVRAERLLGYSRNGKHLLLEGFDGRLLLYHSGTKYLKRIDQIYDHPHSMLLFRYAQSSVSLVKHN